MKVQSPKIKSKVQSQYQNARNVVHQKNDKNPLVGWLKKFWTLDSGLWTLDFGNFWMAGFWTLDFGLWTLGEMDCGLWFLDFGLWEKWTLDFGRNGLGTLDNNNSVIV